MDTLATLAECIRRVFPGSRLEPASAEQVVAIRRQYPDAPDDYVQFLLRVGWGSLAGDNFMVYSGLCEPTELFDETTAAGLRGVVFFGDDFSGSVFGFDTRDEWRLVNVDNCTRPEPIEQQSFVGFLSERVSAASE